MKYKEYLFNNNLEKRLGIFGEIHLYSKEESKFAEKIVPRFEIVAIEGSNKTTSISVIQTLYLPWTIAFSKATKRYITNETCEEIAWKEGKKIEFLEKEYGKSFSFGQKIMMTINGILSIPASPFVYIFYKIQGDPFKAGASLYEWYEKMKPDASELKKRDRIMAENSLKIIKETQKNLLIVCGADHLDGVVKNIESQLSLKEIMTYSI